MKNKKRLMNILYWLFRIGFVLQIIIILQLFYTIFFFSKGERLALLAYSDLRVFNEVDSDKPIDISNLSSLSEAKIFLLPHARSSVVFHSIQSVGVAGWLVIGLNILHYLIWLLFTWKLLKVLQSIKDQQVFRVENINRLRVVAFIVGLSPLILLLRNLVNVQLIQESVVLKQYRIAYFYDYSLFSGLFYMVLILLIVEIFKHGMKLKLENDLTV